MLRARKHKQSSLPPPFPCVRIWEHFTAAIPHIFCAVVFPLLKEEEEEEEEGSSKMGICQERRRIFMLGRSPKEKYEQRKRQGRGQKNKRLSRKKRGGGGKINLGLLLLLLFPPYCSSPSSRVKEEGENAKKQFLVAFLTARKMSLSFFACEFLPHRPRFFEKARTHRKHREDEFVLSSFFCSTPFCNFVLLSSFPPFPPSLVRTH